MIFFQMFTERWSMACQGLTEAQEGIYIRLVVWVYANECPLPLDRNECARIARLSAADGADVFADRNADLGFVLKKFFTRTPRGHEQKKAVAEIDRYQAGEPARAARKEADAQRKRRGREEQRGLYALARERGVKTGPHMSNSELRKLLGIPEPAGNVVHLSAGVSAADASAESAGSPQESPSGNPQDTGGRVAQAQNPLTINHITSLEGRKWKPADASAEAAGPPRALAVLGEGGIDPIPNAPDISPERLRTAVQALRDGGLIGINAGHPMLLELLRAGIRDEALTLAAATAAAKGKGFAYALAIAEGQMRDAAAAAVPTAREREGASRVAQWAPGLEAKW